MVQRALVLALLPAAIQAGALLAYPARASAQTADEIVAKALAARGGVERAKAIQTERITGTIYFTPELYGPFMAEFKRPGKMHNEMTIEGKTVVRTFNGKDGGWMINPFAGKNDPEPMSTDDLKDAANQSDFDGPLIDAKAKGNIIELAGMEKLDGRDAYILKVTHRDGTVSLYSFDKETLLLTKWSGVENIEGKTVTHETFFHDYRDVGGLKFAFELDSSSPGAEITQKILVDKIELDPQIDDSHFEKPQAASTAAPPAPAPHTPPSSSKI